MPYEGQKGTTPDGTRVIFRGGKVYPLDQDPNKGGGFDASAESKKYQDKLAFERAKMDAETMQRASQAEREAYAAEANADQAKRILKQDTPLGGFAGARMAVSNNVPFMRGVLSVPTQDQAANMETLQRYGNQGTLGSVGQLKGPLSDRDIAFLKTLQYNVGSNRESNMRVAMAQKWAAKRQAAYAAALRKWTEVGGSPSALNPQGMSFDRWWGQYAEKALPPPTFDRESMNAELKSMSAGKPKKASGSGGAQILSVRPD